MSNPRIPLEMIDFDSAGVKYQTLILGFYAASLPLTMIKTRFPSEYVLGGAVSMRRALNELPIDPIQNEEFLNTMTHLSANARWHSYQPHRGPTLVQKTNAACVFDRISLDIMVLTNNLSRYFDSANKLRMGNMRDWYWLGHAFGQLTPLSLSMDEELQKSTMPLVTLVRALNTTARSFLA